MLNYTLSDTDCESCQRRHRALNEYPQRCPVCKLPAYYAADLDRYVHAAGTGGGG